jgi:uncharacterized protein (DUF1810 family)
MEKYIKKQKNEYKLAYNEIKRGRKESHWIWYIFPQITGLGKSYMCKLYDIKSLDEAKEYLNNDYLRKNLIDICKVLLTHEGKKDIKDIMNIDDIKLLSSMTLFNKADKEKKLCKGVFKKVMNAFYGGKEDELTLKILEEQENEEKEKLEKRNKGKHEITEKEEIKEDILEKERLLKLEKEKLEKENKKDNNGNKILKNKNKDIKDLDLDSENIIDKNKLKEKIKTNEVKDKINANNNSSTKEMSIDNDNSFQEMDIISVEEENIKSNQKTLDIHSMNYPNNYNKDINSNNKNIKNLINNNNVKKKHVVVTITGNNSTFKNNKINDYIKGEDNKNIADKNYGINYKEYNQSTNTEIRNNNRLEAIKEDSNNGTMNTNISSKNRANNTKIKKYKDTKIDDYFKKESLGK